VSGGSLAALLVVLFACAAARSSGRPARAFIVAAFLAAGFSVGRARIAAPAETAARALGRLDGSRSAEWTGRLDGFWTQTDYGRFATARLESCRQGNAEFPFSAPARVWVSGSVPVPALRGDRFRLTAPISLPDLPASRRDIAQPFVEYELSAKSALLMSRVGSTPLTWISRPNEWLEGLLVGSGLPKTTLQQPIAALLLGRTGSLDRGLAGEFRRGGLLHVLAISGLHVALVAGFLFLVLGIARVPRRARDAAVGLAVVALSIGVGGRMPVLRAALTLAIFVVSRILEKPIAPLQAIGLSALAVLAIDPADLWRAGFFITYGAAAGIVLLTPPLARALRRLPRAVGLSLAVALAAQAAIAPVVLWRFNLVTAFAWIAAPLVVPLGAAMLLLGSAVLLLLALHASPFVPAAGFLAGEKLLLGLAMLTAKGTFLAATPPIAAVVLLAAFLVLASRQTGAARAAGATAYVVLFTVLALRAPVGRPACDFSVEGLDVGQGDAFLLRSGRSAFLIDGGGRFDASDEEFGRTRLLPKLLDRGVVRLDGALVSHPHPDHALGMFSVLREIPVSTLYLGEGIDDGGLFGRLAGAAAARSVPVRRLKAGDEIPWGGGRFLVLRSGGRPFKKDPINNESVVAVFEKGSRRVLFTGDAGAPAEEDLLRGSAPLPKVDLLKVGHHGSRTSSTPAFLEALSPRAALISCGRNNRFGHPAARTMETLARLRIPAFRTDLRSDVGFAVTAAHLFLFERGIP
ncbi:MAG: DNA internalization-related competence protein ComEC/Rec2, partial [Thermoanaerobaculia bacterium]